MGLFPQVDINNAKYETGLRVKEMPSCDTCVPGGIEVKACAFGYVHSLSLSPSLSLYGECVTCMLL